ncbi:Uncharacterised protein (plasmid) [Tsukamurella tyrosinosolvens]|uniref:Uncharacterized protein n=1 Tax=Tsukamurella tyrosinosolvens TaxID=57704 RepID=A0A1H4UZ61_TSUTY|nr:hypothetical protein [Tsukamurella tyrosinosolvens]KXO98416.1 hypothetical protein AXK58_25420 [Tsukamurella tyrosinosolvens]SEC73491.1 hypothetical protein SAMN04489793_3073 [Tsukamurella tyrosinosolvens]VEH90815.1 Uncharacterised protein [Tsukamurella tyrosinosolvens]
MTHNAAEISPDAVAAAYTAMRTKIRRDPNAALSDTAEIRTLANALTEDIVDPDASAEDRFEPVPQTSVRDVTDLLAAAASTIRGLVNDRDALMAARSWERDTELANRIAPPDPAASEQLLAELADTARSTGEFDREVIRAHAVWFHATRNFVVHRESDRQRSDQYLFDAFGVRPSMALLALHQLIDAAEQGAVITADDLVWATQGPERLRGDLAAAPDEYCPPCLRPAQGAS